MFVFFSFLFVYFSFLVLIYSRSPPNISEVVRKHRNILSINKAFKEIFQNEPVTAFRRNKNLKDLIGSNKFEQNKVKKHNNIMKKGKASRVQQIIGHFVASKSFLH